LQLKLNNFLKFKMVHKILKQEKNPLLHRETYTIEIESASNPSFEDVRKIINKDEKLVVVQGVKSNFGRSSFIASALVYDSEEAKDKVEYIPRKIRKKLQEQAKKAEDEKAKAEAKPVEPAPVAEEKPAEEAKPVEPAPVAEEKPAEENKQEPKSE